MEIPESLIEKYLKSLHEQAEKLEKARAGLLEVNKALSDISRNHKNKNYHVEVACKCAQETILNSI